MNGWIRPAFSHIIFILMRPCPRLYSSLLLFHWVALVDCFCALYLNSAWWQVTVHCQEERTPLLRFSPLLSGFEVDDLSPPVSVYRRHYCRFKLWLWGYRARNSDKYLLCFVSQRRHNKSALFQAWIIFLRWELHFWNSWTWSFVVPSDTFTVLLL